MSHEDVQNITINMAELYAEDGTALLDHIPDYERKALAMLPTSRTVDATLTGPAPIWLYLRIAHALHGLVRILSYTSPVTGAVIIFNHKSR